MRRFPRDAEPNRSPNEPKMVTCGWPASLRSRCLTKTRSHARRAPCSQRRKTGLRTMRRPPRQAPAGGWQEQGKALEGARTHLSPAGIGLKAIGQVTERRSSAPRRVWTPTAPNALDSTPPEYSRANACARTSTPQPGCVHKRRHATCTPQQKRARTYKSACLRPHVGTSLNANPSEHPEPMVRGQREPPCKDSIASEHLNPTPTALATTECGVTGGNDMTCPPFSRWTGMLVCRRNCID